jgi:hypothetical protein
MTKHVLFAFVVSIIPLGTFSVYAIEPQSIKWSDLVPGDTIPDPFKKLSREQLDGLSFVVRIRHLVATEKMSKDSPGVEEAAKIEQSLKKAGVDVGWLMAQRRRVGQIREIQAKAVQQNLIGKHVKLSGYVVPVKKSNGLVTEFLLVADVATCSNSSPPPPNQLVYVKARDGIVVQGQVAAVSVTGLIEALETTTAFLRASGPVQYVGAYSITPEAIEVHSATE